MKKWMLVILMMLAMPSMQAISTGAPLGTVVVEKGKPEGMFKKWRAMLTRDAKSSLCVAALDEHCLSKDVLGFISQARSLSDAQKLKKVNAFVNRVRYHSDSFLCGTNDYWASSGEFFSRGKGDCEDFGIAKYALLMA